MSDWFSNEIRERDPNVLEAGGAEFKIASLVLQDIDILPKDLIVSTIKNRLSQFLVDTVIEGWRINTKDKTFRFSFRGGEFIFSFASKCDTVYKERRKKLNNDLGKTDQERRSDKWPLS